MKSVGILYRQRKLQANRTSNFQNIPKTRKFPLHSHCSGSSSFLYPAPRIPHGNIKTTEAARRRSNNLSGRCNPRGASQRSSWRFENTKHVRLSVHRCSRGFEALMIRNTYNRRSKYTRSALIRSDESCQRESTRF